jgi:acyl-CoA synthetase (NDP forming)
VEAAVQAAETLGFPVALKALGPTLVHKTERGAVILNLTSAAEVRRSANGLMARLNGEISGFAVQSMVSGGFEMLVGCVVDPLFGPVLLCSAGGILTELLADSATRLHPLTASDADEMVEELKCVRLLRGYRGQPALDERALKDVLLRISALVSICPEVQELDINPLKILQAGACAVDVRVRVDQAHQTRLTRRVVY